MDKLVDLLLALQTRELQKNSSRYDSFIIVLDRMDFILTWQRLIWFVGKAQKNRIVIYFNIVYGISSFWSSVSHVTWNTNSDHKDNVAKDNVALFPTHFPPTNILQHVLISHSTRIQSPQETTLLGLGNIVVWVNLSYVTNKSTMTSGFTLDPDSSVGWIWFT